MEAGTAQKKSSSQPDEIDVDAMVAERQRARREKEERGEDAEPRDTAEVVKAAAGGEKLEDEEIADALEFFFAEEGDDEAGAQPKELVLNLGNVKRPKKVRFVITPIDEEVIKKIRKESTTGTKAQRRRGDAEVDENLVARRIVAKATIDPDFKELAKRLGIRTDPADAVLSYFRKFGKTGLILQLSGEILNLSGYDEDDVSELDAAGG